MYYYNYIYIYSGKRHRYKGDFSIIENTWFCPILIPQQEYHPLFRCFTAENGLTVPSRPSQAPGQRGAGPPPSPPPLPLSPHRQWTVETLAAAPRNHPLQLAPPPPVGREKHLHFLFRYAIEAINQHSWHYSLKHPDIHIHCTFVSAKEGAWGNSETLSPLTSGVFPLLRLSTASSVDTTLSHEFVSLLPGN